MRQLRDERLLLEARATQAASGAASVAAQKRQLEVPLPPGPAGGGQQPASQAVVATAQSEPEDPFGVSDSDSGGSNPFGASTASEEDEEETGGADAMMFGPTSTASAAGSGTPAADSNDADAVSPPFTEAVQVPPAVSRWSPAANTMPVGCMLS